MIKKIVLLNILVVLACTTIAQKKYAVLICGEQPVEEGYHVADAGSGWADPGDTIRNEFWDDTYLMWEMLVFEKGFDDDNVFVLYYDGNDNYADELAPRYNADESHQDYYPITDYSATKSNAENVFNGLTTGSGGFPQLTEDDFLFVWTFGHGGTCGEIEFHDCLILYENSLTDIEFAALVNPIPAHKKVYWMQQCLGGSFADNLAAVDAVFHSAGTDENGTIDERTAAPADNNWDTENEIINGIIYQHGEFDFHNYSSTLGESPAYSNSYGNEPYTDADLNQDNYISIYESWIWEQSHETKEEIPLYSDLGNIGSYTSLEYPTLLHTDITANQTHRGLIGVSKDIHITAGNQLVFFDNANVYLLNEAKIIVDVGATLVINDGVSITSTNDANKISVNGNIQVGQGVIFQYNSNSGYCIGLTLNNSTMHTSLDQVTFNGAQLHNYGAELNIANCNFISCPVVYSHYGDVTVTNSSFQDTWLYIENTTANQSLVTTVDNCLFTGNQNNGLAAIDILNYSNFVIEDNTVNGYYNGLQVWQSGGGTSPYSNRNIYNNEIYNCLTTGITVYNSTVSLALNYLHGNTYGIRVLNNSNTSLNGNSLATNYCETNYIADNSSYEVYASTYSFPWYFRYNVIIDHDNLGNPTDPMVYYQPSSGGVLLKDVKYNCWGNNFSMLDDLYPTGYMEDPIQCPPNGGHKSTEIALEDFQEGLDYFENGQYDDAKTSFESVIEQYPKTQYAGAAMKELFALEKFAENDYSALQQYYETNDSIQADTVLTKLAVFLSNKCEVELQNWQTAIDHFENVIENPETPEDSIFAIIDLGYTYLLMGDSGYKSTAQGRLLEYKPTSVQSFSKNRDYLISLLPFGKSEQAETTLFDSEKTGQLLQNIPNPFSNTTTIQFNLNSKEFSNVEIRIHDQVGKEVQRIPVKSAKEGTNTVELNMQGLPAGIYYYSLIVNGTKANTKKMVVL